jgi:hypothetical protein
MKRALTLFLLASQLATFSVPARAAEGAPPDAEPTARSLFHGQFETIPSELASPWTEARTWLLVGVGLTGALAVLKPQGVDPVQDYFRDRQPLGSFSRLGDFGGLSITNGLYILGMGSHFLATDDRRSFRRAASMLKATVYSASTTFLIKYGTQSRRPDGSDRLSFPSGHSTAAFAFATYVTAEHGIAWGAPAFALAALTAASRMNDNRHYLHDVVGGAVVGTVWALGVHAVQTRDANEKGERAQTSSSVQFFPLFADDVLGLGALIEI